ncbi:hypothetical protein J4558_04090 [Leptolyngbya sp. 15MV]|nr:hypothetical protein J4558_04090 [Leptolyngbya sp. 15MV]
MATTTRAPAHTLRRRPGWFHPVPLRSRRDGWSAARQCAFLVQLYVTGSVTTAARAVGMSRASAYRLRERAEAASFAHAWDRVLSLPGWERAQPPREDFRKVTTATLLARLERELVQPVVHRGAMAGIRTKPDISTLLRLVRRTERWPLESYEGE